MYTTNSYKNPFWAENSGFLTGRDPLGIQNSSITTYSRLLPGMTNLTLRIRYYGFYMWLLHEYDKIAEKDSTQLDQYNFVRRAELIMAFLMMHKHPGETGVIGSDYTQKKQKEQVYNSIGFYDVHQGADKTIETKKGSVYWDFESGALGQYYAGSLIALDLIDISGKYFRILEKGKHLAQAFNKNISPAQSYTYLHIIESGKLTFEAIDAITDFTLNNIQINSDEWNFYINLLIDLDGINLLDNTGTPTRLRKETIKLYLEHISVESNTDSSQKFAKNQFHLNFKHSGNDASYGWHYYYLNEAFHIALETIFWSVLVEIEPREQQLESLLDKMLEKTLSEAEKTYLNEKSNIIVFELIESMKNSNLVEAIEELESNAKSKHSSMTALAIAFQLILIIYARYHERLDELKQFEKKYKIWGQKGRITENLVVYVQSFLAQPFSIFVRESIKMVLNDHVNTAYRKMGNGESNLLKFIIEDGSVFHVQTMSPKRTSPRIKALEKFIRDLKLSDANNQITDHGISLLDKMN